MCAQVLFVLGSPAGSQHSPLPRPAYDALPNTAPDAVGTVFLIQPHLPHVTDRSQNSEHLKECKNTASPPDPGPKRLRSYVPASDVYHRSLYGRLIHQQALLRLPSCKAVRLQRRKGAANSFSGRKHTADLIRYLKLQVSY